MLTAGNGRYSSGGVHRGLHMCLHVESLQLRGDVITTLRQESVWLLLRIALGLCEVDNAKGTSQWMLKGFVACPPGQAPTRGGQCAVDGVPYDP